MVWKLMLLEELILVLEYNEKNKIQLISFLKIINFIRSIRFRISSLKTVVEEKNMI
jgi:hypothetical protein